MNIGTTKMGNAELIAARVAALLARAGVGRADLRPPLRVRDVMSHAVTAQEDATIGVALRAIEPGDVEAVVVLDGDAVVGVIDPWDAIGLDPDTLVRHVATGACRTLHPLASVREAAMALRAESAPGLAVVECDGTVAGIVTRRDLRGAGLSPAEVHRELPFEELGVSG